METSEYLMTVESLHREARRRGLFFLTCDDERLSGRSVSLGGRDVVSFSSCSYLGLEQHPRLVEAVRDAVGRWGTQFSSSRGYLSAPPYRLLEEQLSFIFGGAALVTSSTTLGHQVALGVLCTEKDAIVLDHQAHKSIHMAATLARAGGTTVDIVRHGELERALTVVADLAKRRRTVWFALDGVFSMYGDMAPVELCSKILDVAPNVRLYVDDAHGMSWAGEHGRGSFLSRMPLTERMVLVTSLNKAFSAAGGCIVLPTVAERELVRMTGGPMVFSGPVPPPMLGAALASAEVHLSHEIIGLQQALRVRTDLANARLVERGLPLLCANESPIFFLGLGLPRAAFAVAERMLADGFYVNVSTYPSVPMKRAGIRLTLTAAHAPADIERAIGRLAVHVPEVLDEEGVDREELSRLFEQALPRPERPAELTDVQSPVRRAPIRQGGMRVLRARTIHDMDRALWDRALGGVGAVSWEAMAAAERIFSGQQRIEHNWEMLYLAVMDQAGSPLAVTCFTSAVAKDDMLMRDEVSRAVEARRTADAYFLTSRVLSMGSWLSEGNHLWLDRTRDWKHALRRVLDEAEAEYERTRAGALVLRDLPAGDPELAAYLVESGFLEIPMLRSHLLPVTWKDGAGFLATLNYSKRRVLKHAVALSPLFHVSVEGPTLSAEHVSHLYRLYRNVAERKLKLNVFALPFNLIGELSRCPSWEIVTLRLDPARGGPPDGAPVAWYAAHKHGGHYAPFFGGIDYRFLESHGVYRQMLLQIVLRATALRATLIHLGMDADMEKHRLGSISLENRMYVHAHDDFGGAQLREMVAEVGLKRRTCRASEG